MLLGIWYSLNWFRELVNAFARLLDPSGCGHMAASTQRAFMHACQLWD